MRSLFRAILWLPKFIIRAIWRFVLGFLQTIVVIGLLAFGLLYYADHSSTPFANTISNIKQTVINLVHFENTFNQ
ncbi:hypothetical protein HMPREF9318_00637 [Streptococcus urinalis FB127-CNA-2]|uniref:Uncharacterized protein n=1 Tax=Streptococcus urinalis 2285-97 TaxID=764291 RepID=G5KGZ9_9STRE|nr:hypothetical protein [Streptococcus urinalis]EHJ57356.1 hypothetical protein STRUR_1393 [Streptococcus urinalis 2285-97]EKS22439.1 hypothetical protein HMPREF9318_00637 [Streptococcus urinalis FB127-CNA-2]VEF32252.1 Uncharacterised protein [Streptococcus urinalis]